MKTILVTGGAGYIGSVLVKLLLNKGYKVRVLDILRYGGESIIELFNNLDFSFIKGDVRNKSDIVKAIDGVDAVVNFAAIVGDPACAKEPELARNTNFEGTKLLYTMSNEKSIKQFVFASTCSNYGKMKDHESYVNEESELIPVSFYAETKVNAEKYLLSQSKSNICKPTCLRFSTVYGPSPRMRFDLTVNEFTKEVAFNVYNVGDTNENYQKQMLVDEIKKHLHGSRVKYVHKNEDPRDYKVSFMKIRNELGFEITKTVPDGIKQIIQVVKDGIFINPDDKKYRNS
ncbi:MAG: NAD(P)-dependent oxidoreductase [Bacteroidia bacterium]|nr:NAD(P)-dependent oxidoreductase [Bacteroidia bacterium]